MNIHNKNTKPTNYTPDMRIVVRDAEWVVRKSDPTVDGGYLIECEGISEPVNANIFPLKEVLFSSLGVLSRFSF